MEMEMEIGDDGDGVMEMEIGDGDERAMGRWPMENRAMLEYDFVLFYF